MIQTSLSNLIVIYLLLLLVGTVSLWLLQDSLRRWRERRATRDDHVCRICGVSFRTAGAGRKRKRDLVKCPECRSLNERGGGREI